MKESQKEAIKKIVASKRYTYDPVDGGIFSHVVKYKEPVKIKPSLDKHGNNIYCMWTEDNERLMVYGQHFTWFACGYELFEKDQITFKDKNKSNTRILNLKIRYNKQRTTGHRKPVQIGPNMRPPRKPMPDQMKKDIIQDYYGNIPYTKTQLAEKYGVHRHSVTRLISKL